MSEHTEWYTKPCSIPGHCLLIGPSTGRHKLSLQMPIETAELIVKCCKAFPAMGKALEDVQVELRHFRARAIDDERFDAAREIDNRISQVKAALAAGGAS